MTAPFSIALSSPIAFPSVFSAFYRSATLNHTKACFSPIPAGSIPLPCAFPSTSHTSTGKDGCSMWKHSRRNGSGLFSGRPPMSSKPRKVPSKVFLPVQRSFSPRFNANRRPVPRKAKQGAAPKEGSREDPGPGSFPGPQKTDPLLLPPGDTPTQDPHALRPDPFLQ